MAFKNFRMRQDAENWFSNIRDQKPIRTKFDLYYFCLMLGLAANRRSEPTKHCPEVTDFTDNFVSDYKPYQRLIIGLLIRAELSRLGVSVTEKDEVRKLFVDLVNPQNPTNLTDSGMDRLNEYSSGGYDYLAEKLDSKPYHVEEFLRTYARLLRGAVAQNPNWKGS
ncbi:hypothetical protein [Leptolyngbya ohadii]|uniref:hypothetical protein n=1 Tax=Leptolyngbya ohadii TaxID=1962290 RepID=UPI000B5988E4|nr:hypothetical protein [Leptolyngbya ohadii]